MSITVTSDTGKRLSLAAAAGESLASVSSLSPSLTTSKSGSRGGTGQAGGGGGGGGGGGKVVAGKTIAPAATLGVDRRARGQRAMSLVGSSIIGASMFRGRRQIGKDDDASDDDSSDDGSDDDDEDSGDGSKPSAMAATPKINKSKPRFAAQERRARARRDTLEKISHDAAGTEVVPDLLIPKLVLHSCLRCGNMEAANHLFGRCGKCKTARYCSRQCQFDHWRDVHIQMCVHADDDDEA
jgi:hypothetical protein